MTHCRLLLVLVLCACPVCVGHAQPGGGSASKVTWTIQGDTLAHGGRGRVTFRARVAEGWKMYAPDSPPPTIGASVTVIGATPSALTLDSLAHTPSTAAHDPNFGTTVRFFSGRARLWLPVTLSPSAPSGPHFIEGTLRFMVCSDEICLPPATTSFSAPIRSGTP